MGEKPPAKAGDTGLMEDSRCCGTAKPMSHCDRAWALEPAGFFPLKLEGLEPRSAARETTALRRLHLQRE